MTGPPGFDFASLYAGGTLPSLADVNSMSLPEALAWYNRNGYHARPVWSHPSGYRALVMPPGTRYSFDDLEPPSAAEVAYLAQNWQASWQLGLVLGQRSGLWALDVDDLEQWQRFLAEHGDDTKPTAEQVTGSGKLHLVYRRPENGAGPLLRQEAWSREFPGVEVKSKGFVIAAPSVHHATGQPYRWRAEIPEPADPSPRLLGSRLPAIEDELARHKAADLRIMDKARRMVAAEGRPPMALLSMDQVRERPRPVDLIDGLVPAPVPGTSCIGTFFGASGAYKSFLAVHMALCVRSGQPFLGLPVLATGSSVLVLGEGQAGAGLRADAALDASPALSRGGQEHQVRYLLQAFPLADEPSVTELIGLCRGVKDLRFIWLDSLADFYGDEDESSATGMQRVLAQMRRISAELGCTVIASGHTGHGPRDEDGEEAAMERQRGTSRFRQAWDFEIQATGRALVVRKERDAEKLPPIPYRLEKRLGSLAVAAGAAGEPDEPEWPHPVTGDQLGRVMAAITATPGLSGNSIVRASGVRREIAMIAIAKADGAGLVVNTGTKGTPKWSPNPATDGLSRWLDEALKEAG